MAFLRKGKARQESLVIIGWKRYWYLCTCSTREMAMSSSRPLLLRSWSIKQNKFSLSKKIFLKHSERVASVSCKACKIPEICQTCSMLAILEICALCHSFAHRLRRRAAGIGNWWEVCWTQTAVLQIWFLNLLCGGEESTKMATEWVAFQNSYLCQIIVNFSSTKKEFANFLWIFWCWTRLWDHTSKWCPCIWSKSSFCYLHLVSISKILLSMSISNARPW